MFKTAFGGISGSGERMVRVPLQTRLVRHDHYVLNPRTGVKKLFRQSFAREIVREGVFTEQTAPRDLPDLKKTWPANRSDPSIVVREHVTIAKPWDGSDPRSHGRDGGRQGSTPGRFGDFDLR